MTAELRFHRITTVLLTAALLATLTVALTGGQPAEAIDGPVEVVYVATGRNFPDALAGSTLAATAGAPLLTVEPNLPLPDTTITALQSLDPDRIVVLGGPVAVSDAVVGALADYARSGSVTRIEGTDRHDTAAQIADALPDKVHDADRLDGLDSSAFLRGADITSVSKYVEAVSGDSGGSGEVQCPVGTNAVAGGHAIFPVGGNDDVVVRVSTRTTYPETGQSGWIVATTDLDGSGTYDLSVQATCVRDA